MTHSTLPQPGQRRWSKYQNWFISGMVNRYEDVLKEAFPPAGDRLAITANDALITDNAISLTRL
jgi:hypothetical protein